MEEAGGEHDDDALMRGLADLLAKNVEGRLHRASSHEHVASGEDPFAPVLPRPGLRIDGKRELLRLIGSGSFGSVYEARQLDLDRLEAIKFLHERWMAPEHEEIRTRFLAEARVMARMRGTHLVQVHDFGTLPGGLPYFVMERLEGKTLRARLRETTGVSLFEFFEIATSIVEGLHEAHAHEVIHRDVKPENVFLAGDGVKLLDFGLAKTSEAMSTTDALMGTPLYMAPELVTGEGQPDVRSDLYAAAVVMYEMLTGQAPFRRPSMTRRQLEQAVVQESAAPLGSHRSDLPEGLEALVLAGLAKQPRDRPSTARELLDRLLEIRTRWVGADADTRPALHDRLETEPRVDTKRERSGGRARGRTWTLATIVVLGVVLSAALLLAIAWPPMDDVHGAWGGFLITRPHWASTSTKDAYEALCAALGADRTLPRDTMQPIPVHCVPVSSWNGTDARLHEAGNAVGAKAVVHVDDGRVRLQLLDRASRLTLLGELSTLELTIEADALVRLAPVLQALLRPDESGFGEVPVLDPDLDGFHWALLAEELRRYQGHRDPQTRARLERLARCSMEDGLDVGSRHCNAARLLLALEMPCDRAIAPMRELLEDDAREGEPLGPIVRLELARCLARADGLDATVAEAERHVEAVLAARPEDPCVLASAMSIVARLAIQGGDHSGALRMRTTLEPSTLRACPARTMVVRELAARADVFATASPPRWCDAARDGAEAHDLAPEWPDALVNWAEASLLCSDTTGPARQAVLDELEPARYQPGQARTSVAFMRWLMTQEPIDARAVLKAYLDVPAGEVPLLQGVASGLEPCARATPPCAHELLTRPKTREDQPALLLSLGLGDPDPSR